MKKKFLYLCLFVTACVLGYVAIKSYDFHKYHSKLKMDELKPNVSLEQLLGKNNLKVRYIKRFTYDNNFIGFNAIVDNKYYVSVTHLGKIYGDLKIGYQKETFKQNQGIGFPPPDTIDEAARFMNFSGYPFKVSTIDYQIKGQELQVFNNSFKEIVFKGDYFIISFNGKKQREFAYVTPNKEMSVSFINYNNELYIVNTQPYKNNPFYSLHSLLKSE